MSPSPATFDRQEIENILVPRHSQKSFFTPHEIIAAAIIRPAETVPNSEIWDDDKAHTALLVHIGQVGPDNLDWHH